MGGASALAIVAAGAVTAAAAAAAAVGAGVVDAEACACAFAGAVVGVEEGEADATSRRDINKHNINSQRCNEHTNRKKQAQVTLEYIYIYKTTGKCFEMRCAAVLRIYKSTQFTLPAASAAAICLRISSKTAF